MVHPWAPNGILDLLRGKEGALVETVEPRGKKEEKLGSDKKEDVPGDGEKNLSPSS